AGSERQRTTPGDIVAATRLRRAVNGMIRHRHGLVIRGRERDREREEGRLALAALLLAHVADADPRLIVHDRADTLTITNGRVDRVDEVDEEGLVRFAEAVAVHQDVDGLARLA